MQNRILAALGRGETVTGMIHFTGSPMMIEVMAAAGLDFAIIDMEHCPLDLDRLGHLIRAADAAGLTPFVRIPEVDPALIKKVLNLGAMGIAIPHANRANCAAALRAARYAPDGERGACPIVRATRYWPGDWNAYAATANREVMVIPLIEDVATLDDFEALAAMPGLDGYFIGPYDLSVSAGVPGVGFDHPVMSAALDKVVAAARRHGKHVMTTVGDRQEPAYSRMLSARGVQMLVFATDALVFMHAVRRLVAFREG